MSTPTSPVAPSKASLWVALGVLGGGILAIILLVVIVVVPNITNAAPTPIDPPVTQPSNEPSDEPVDDPATEPDEPVSGDLPTGNLDFDAGSAVTADMTVAVMASVGDMDDWTFGTPPQGFTSSYTNGSCTVDMGTYVVSPEDSALGDEESTFLAIERMLKISDRSVTSVTEWGYAPESIQGDSTASMIEARWTGTDGLSHSGALRSVGTSGIGVLFHTSCADKDTLDAAVKELRPNLSITVLSFDF